MSRTILPTRTLRKALAVSALVLTGALGVGACEPEDLGGGPNGDGGTTCRADARCATGDGGGTSGDAGPRPTDLVALEIAPADPVLDAVDGARPTVTFTATARQRDNTTRALATNVRFSIDTPALGAIDAASGVFTAAGVGGTARVRVETTDGSGLSATTMLTVNVRRVVLGPGVTMADRTMFEGAMPAADGAMTGPEIAYPLNRAVMPRNVFPPRVMWTPRHMANATDVYRVRLRRPNATVDAYLRASAMGFNHSWQPAPDVFRPLSDSNINEPIQTTVAVLSGGQVRERPGTTFRTVDAVIGGAVYYWSPPRGRLTRIDVDTARRVDFLPNPAGGCIACHTVTRDGRRLVAVTNDGRPLASFDLTRDLTGNPPPTLFRNATHTMRTSSFNGDGTRLVTAPHGGGAMAILNGMSGMDMARPGMPTGMDPEWSPDSRNIAYARPREGTLYLLPANAGDTFGPETMLLPGMAGMLNWHASWSPDSNWLAFQRGSATSTTGTGSIWLISRMGGMPTRLDNLNGGPATQNNWRPVMSPFNSGGYFWVLFTSTRDYGNATAGVRGQKLIWIAAVSNRPTAGMDPSEVPYFMEGQEPVTNLDPRWAPPPCRANGDTCSAGGDCCSGSCEPDMGGRNVCRTPTGMCRMRGATCASNSDCCSGLTCTGGICDVPLPG